MSDTSHVGDLLVQIGGLALCATGVVLMTVLWRRQQRSMLSTAGVGESAGISGGVSTGVDVDPDSDTGDNGDAVDEDAVKQNS